MFVGELHERSLFSEEPVVRRREQFARLDARVGGANRGLGDIGGVHGAEEMLEALLRRRAGRDVSGARDASREGGFLKSRGATFANASVCFACSLIWGRPRPQCMLSTSESYPESYCNPSSSMSARRGEGGVVVY